MNQARFTSIFNGLSAVAKKVYEAVPISEPWPASKINAELIRLNVANRDLRIIEGCINSLVNAGVVDEPSRGQFVRTPIHSKSPKAPEIKPMPVPKQASEPTATTTPDAIDQLTALSARAVQLASSMRVLAADLDNAALDLAAQMQENEVQTQKFKQLQALLKGMG